MKTNLNLTAQTLKSLVIMISLSVSGMMISSCSKENLVSPVGSTAAQDDPTGATAAINELSGSSSAQRNGLHKQSAAVGSVAAQDDPTGATALIGPFAVASQDDPTGATHTIDASSGSSSGERNGIHEMPLIFSESLGGFRGTPQYSFAAFKSGKVVYTGIRGVGTIGERQFDVGAEKVQQLVDFMIQQGFLSMKDKYTFICDGAQHTTRLSGNLDRKSYEKTVIDYSVAVPYQLLLIRETLEEKLGIKALLNDHTSATLNSDQISQ